MHKILLDRGPIRAEVHSEAPEAVLQQLEQTAYGTEGLAYVHGNVREKANLLPDPYFITLKKRDQLLATVALSHRDGGVKGQPYRSYYIRYFSFMDALRRPNQHQPDRKPMRAGNRLLRPLLWSLFERTDPANPEALAQPTLYYAYVEAENQRSYEMCQTFGFKPLRTMTTIPFSRAYPKANPAVRLLTPEEQPAMRQRLEAYYQDYSFVSFDTCFAGQHYYVWEENGKVVAGVQAYPITWKFKALPGVSGWVSMKIVPRLPVLGRLFNPKRYRFAAIEGLWHAPGREDLILPLLESALAHESLTVAMLFVDKHGPQYELIKGYQKDLGLMYKLNGEVDSEVIGRFAHAGPHDVSTFEHTPVYVSAFDCT